MIRSVFMVLAVWLCALPAIADTLKVSTVTRAPFSMPDGETGHTGFSMDLINALAQDMGHDLEITRFEQFGDMLKAVETGTHDLAIANISITSEREAVMDFSHPIYAAGLQIMAPAGSGDVSLLSVLRSPGLWIMVAAGFAFLAVAGMLMWVFERGRQEYFDRPLGEAPFPAFWWALNLFVNGGFEERMPRSIPGRFLGVVMVLGSLFIVSAFVAQITTMMTVGAIQGSVNGLNDLYTKRVATIEGSTAARFLQARDISYVGHPSLDALLEDFESGTPEAVVFDAPILAYYLQTRGAGKGELIGAVFKPENYGIAITAGSEVVEEINVSLLRLRENGTYDELQQKWFGVIN